VDGPWITGSTWNSREKISVGGSVAWTSTTAFRKSGSTLRVTGNALPKHTTVMYPVRATDAAYRYDRNPNSISAQTLAYSLPATPRAVRLPLALVVCGRRHVDAGCSQKHAAA